MDGACSQQQEEGAESAAGERTSDQSSQQQFLHKDGQRAGVEAKLSNQQQQVVEEEDEPSDQRSRQGNKQLLQVAEEGEPSNQRSRQENKQLLQVAEEGEPSNQRSRQENKQLLQAAEDGEPSNQQSRQKNKQLLQVAEEGEPGNQRSGQKYKQLLQVAEEAGKLGNQRSQRKNKQLLQVADTAPLTDPHQLEYVVFLSQNRKKHWIEGKTGASCFMLFARELSISWADKTQYWNWFSAKETSNVDVEVAKLREVCWLDVSGNFETSILTPNTTYVVVFVVKMDESADGWHEPVTIKLVGPEGKVQEREEGLEQKPRGKWMEVYAGNFIRTSKGEEIQFSLLNHSNDIWKKGLVVKGAVIRPKKSG